MPQNPDTKQEPKATVRNELESAECRKKIVYSPPRNTRDLDTNLDCTNIDDVDIILPYESTNLAELLVLSAVENAVPGAFRKNTRETEFMSMNQDTSNTLHNLTILAASTVCATLKEKGVPKGSCADIQILPSDKDDRLSGLIIATHDRHTGNTPNNYQKVQSIINDPSLTYLKKKKKLIQYEQNHAIGVFVADTLRREVAIDLKRGKQINDIPKLYDSGTGIKSERIIGSKFEKLPQAKIYVECNNLVFDPKSRRSSLATTNPEYKGSISRALSAKAKTPNPYIAKMKRAEALEQMGLGHPEGRKTCHLSDTGKMRYTFNDPILGTFDLPDSMLHNSPLASAVVIREKLDSSLTNSEAVEVVNCLQTGKEIPAKIVDASSEAKTSTQKDSHRFASVYQVPKEEFQNGSPNGKWQRTTIIDKLKSKVKTFYYKVIQKFAGKDSKPKYQEKINREEAVLHKKTAGIIPTSIKILREKAKQKWLDFKIEQLPKGDKRKEEIEAKYEQHHNKIEEYKTRTAEGAIALAANVSGWAYEFGKAIKVLPSLEEVEKTFDEQLEKINQGEASLLSEPQWVHYASSDSQGNPEKVHFPTYCTTVRQKVDLQFALKSGQKIEALKSIQETYDLPEEVEVKIENRIESIRKAQIDINRENSNESQNQTATILHIENPYLEPGEIQINDRQTQQTGINFQSRIFDNTPGNIGSKSIRGQGASRLNSVQNTIQKPRQLPPIQPNQADIKIKPKQQETSNGYGR